MRNLIMIAIVMLVGCVTVSGWEDAQKEKAMNSCMSSMVRQAPYQIANVFCNCMVKELEKGVPVYDEAKINEWFSNGSVSISGAFCTEEVKAKLNLK